MMTELESYSESYVNSQELNDRIYNEFTDKAISDTLLFSHRDYIEKNQLGCGDSAFHYLWLLIAQHLVEKFGSFSGLEIGVYKGQVISLWSLLAKTYSWKTDISAVSPLEGNTRVKTKPAKLLKIIFDKQFRNNRKIGNNYEICDYYNIVNNLFSHFNLDFDSVNLYRGFSNDEKILSELSGKKFNAIYIDGDHSYDGVINDLKNYLPKIVKGGLLVMDDASYFLPSSVFWKGHKEVSRAAETIPQDKFRNVLNIGHNRVYQKISEN
jgi:hypothetical protein